VLAHGGEIVVMPVPAVLRNVPALAKEGLPLPAANALPLAVRSNVAGTALLKTAVPSNSQRRRSNCRRRR